MTGGLIVFLFLAVLVLIIIAKTAIVVPQQSAYVVERLGRYSRHAQRRLPHPDAVRRRHPLPALAEGNGASTSRRRSASRATTCRCGVDGVLYLKVLNPERASYGISDYIFAITPARADDAAQRGRQDRSRPDVRGAHQHQHRGRQRARQGVGAVGRQGAALRDQEHHAAARHPGGDGKADARRAREARGDPDLRRRSATRRSTPPKATSSRSSRRRKRAGSSRSTRPKARRRRSWRSPRPPPKASAGSPRRSSCPAATRPCSCASPSSTSRSSASSPRRATRWSCRPTSPTSAR